MVRRQMDLLFDVFAVFCVFAHYCAYAHAKILWKIFHPNRAVQELGSATSSATPTSKCAVR